VMVTVPKSPLTLILSPENGGEEIPLSPLAGRGSGCGAAGCRLTTTFDHTPSA
jgi:hypothetical protein